MGNAIIRFCTAMAASQCLWRFALPTEAAQLPTDDNTKLMLRLDGDLLDDDANADLPDRIVFSGLPPGSYNVMEGSPPQWIAESITCDDGSHTELDSARARIDLQSGEDVSCSFVSRFQEEIPIFTNGFE